jgi:DNA-binding response OmpR family regulator
MHRSGHSCRAVPAGRQTAFAPSVTEEPFQPLEGENIDTTHWEDARHWMSIYADLIEFKRGLLDRIRRDLTRLPPVAQRAAEADLKIIETQMDGYRVRLALWYRRVLELHGLWLDPETRMIRYQGADATLTVREFQLLQFLLTHPHRYFTVPQILSQAWASPNLFPEEVRTYVQRVRRVLAELKIPCDIANRPRHGYALEFRDH